MTAFKPFMSDVFPSEGLCEFEELRDDRDWLTISLRHSSGLSLVIRFDAYMSYRWTDEGERLILLGQDWQRGASIYEAAESDFLSWLTDESCGVRSGDKIRHFMIVTLNDVLDVLSLEPPIIELTNR